MRIHLRCLTAVLATLTAAACGASSPTMPSSGAIASVTLSSSSVVAGSTIQGTITLASAAGTGGATVALSSSNSGVAIVPASVVVAENSTTATFSVWGAASGSATITASLNGSSRQSPALTVLATPQIASLTVAPSTVVGGSIVTATVTLSGPAPITGAIVTLSSDGVAIVPAIVTIPGAGTTATFTVATQVVTVPTTSTIHGTYGGASATATILLTRAIVPTAHFGVNGSNVTETCAVINHGTALDCTFDGSTSSSPGNITAYDWTWAVAGTPKIQTTTGPLLAGPSFSCTMLPAPPIPASGSLTMTVTLKIHDDAGNVSDIATDAGVRLLPQGSCGY